MPNTGDSYTVALKATHLGWGVHRHTNTRSPITGECYIPIPSQYAQQFGIYNSNQTQTQDILGQNIFNAQSSDGHFQGVVKTSGNSHAGSTYAKNISGQGNLKAFNHWFTQMNVTIGTQIIVEWTSPTDILFTII